MTLPAVKMRLGYLLFGDRLMSLTVPLKGERRNVGLVVAVSGCICGGAGAVFRVGGGAFLVVLAAEALALVAVGFLFLFEARRSEKTMM